MDQEPLVTEEIVEGRRFLERFVAGGHAVNAAAWIERDNGFPWSLYVATDLYDVEGPLSAYTALVNCQGDEDSSVSGGNVTLISPKNRIAIDIAALAIRHPNRSGFPIRVDHVGSLDDVKQVYVYSPWVFAAAPAGSMTAEDVGKEVFRLLQRGTGPQPTSRVTLKDGTGFEGRPLALFAGDPDSMRVQFVASPDLAVRDLKLGEIAAIR